MVQLDKVKIKIQEYILSQIDNLGTTNPAIKLVKPLAKRAIVNNMDGINKGIVFNQSDLETFRQLLIQE